MNCKKLDDSLLRIRLISSHSTHLTRRFIQGKGDREVSECMLYAPSNLPLSKEIAHLCGLSTQGQGLMYVRTCDMQTCTYDSYDI